MRSRWLRDIHRGINTAEFLAATSRTGKAGSNTAADHIDVLTQAISQVPAAQRKNLLVRGDGAGASHKLLTWLTEQGQIRGRKMEYSVGYAVRPFREHRRVVEAIIYRFRVGVPGRDLPREFGPWQTVWKRHRRVSGDCTWDTILAKLLTEADAAGEIDWTVSVDSTINRAHQHATNLPRADPVTGGSIE